MSRTRLRQALTLHRAVTLLTAWVVAGGLLAMGPSARAANSPYDVDRPGLLYWYRRGDSVVEPAPMDERVWAMADAFGRRNYAECERRARWVIGTHSDASVQQQAVLYIVLSGGAAGDLESARSIAQEVAPAHAASEALFHLESLRLGCNRRIAEYNERRLDPRLLEAPHTRLVIAHMYRQAGLPGRAELEYRAVVQDYPSSMYAIPAVSHLVELRLADNDFEGVATMVGSLADRPRGSVLAAQVCQSVLDAVVTRRACSTNDARGVLEGIATRYRGAQVADLAGELVRGLPPADRTPRAQGPVPAAVWTE